MSEEHYRRGLAAGAGWLLVLSGWLAGSCCAGWLASGVLAVLRLPPLHVPPPCSPLDSSNPTPIVPAGLLRLTFADGDVYQWNKVTTSINNLILGKIYIDHGGIMKVGLCGGGGVAV